MCVRAAGPYSPCPRCPAISAVLCPGRIEFCRVSWPLSSGMDIPAEVIIAAGAVMAGAIARLYRRQTVNEDRCEESRAAMAKELATIRAQQVKEVSEFARMATKIATDQLATNNRLATVLTDVGGVLYQSMRTLRKYEPHATPPPGSLGALMVKPPNGDTTEFFEQEQVSTKSGTAAEGM